MNRLANAASPYLQQHRTNPVDWWEWSDEAFAEARRLNRPIILSVGYAACHWCHVMAHESFEDEEVAAVMNSLFVSIKVDREERPDIDHIYMSALHALGEQGGWPLTMFLTPDQEPFWGGTYFPKTPRYGRPGFAQLLEQVADVFVSEPARVRHNALALQQALSTQPIPPSPEPTHKEFIDAARKAASAFDAQRGGLQGAPKFPNAPILNMLWRAGAQAPDLRKPVLQTLRQMALGGIHDHIGGGFARYSVDPLWLVPHFEKMLYDNAQLLELYALAAQYTGESIYRDAAHGIVAWLTREMTLPNGAFASSLDADSEGHEGRSYVWKRSEIESNLSPDDADLFSRAFDITEEGNFEGANIPNRLAESAHTAQEEARVEDIKRILLAARMRRVQPERDDKVLADWNGLMIAALARASLLLDEPSWIPKAHNAYRFIRTHMCPAGRLAHSWRGQVGISPAFALDHAAMALAALALAEAAQDAAPGLVAEAISDMGTLLSHYSGPDSKVIAMTSDLGEPLLVRPRPTHDEATPNANGVALEALYRCAHMAMDDRLAAHADELIAALAGSMRTQSLAHASHWSALDLRLNAAQILVTGEEPSELATAAAAVPFPNRILAGLPSGVAPPPGHPAYATFKTTAGPTAYVCVGMRCSLPIQDPTQIADAVASLRA